MHSKSVPYHSFPVVVTLAEMVCFGRCAVPTRDGRLASASHGMDRLKSSYEVQIPDFNWQAHTLRDLVEAWVQKKEEESRKRRFLLAGVGMCATVVAWWKFSRQK